jgi:hypothetical protein
MKIDKDVKKFVMTVFGIGAICIAFSVLSGCGKTNTVVGSQGPAGAVGPSGTPGASGSNGLSVVSSSTAATAAECSNGGTVIAMAQAPAGTPYNTSEPDQTIVVVCNGQNGQVPLSIMYPIAPCTNASSPYKEQLLCLNDGGLLGDFSDSASGLNTRFAFIPTGSYADTDDSGCQFNVSVDAKGDSTLSYSAGSNQYGKWVAGSVTCVNNE